MAELMNMFKGYFKPEDIALVITSGHYELMSEEEKMTLLTSEKNVLVLMTTIRKETLSCWIKEYVESFDSEFYNKYRLLLKGEKK